MDNSENSDRSLLRSLGNTSNSDRLLFEETTQEREKVIKKPVYKGRRYEK